MAKEKWYRNGLKFTCQGCGNCCSGPNEGYIWLNEEEINRIAAYLKIPADQLTKTMARKVRGRYSLIEKEPSKDCIFLSWPGQGRKGCEIYPVRPVQCRTWPFWKENLRSESDWRNAAQGCPGIDQGQLHEYARIEACLEGMVHATPQEAVTMEQALRWTMEHLDVAVADSPVEQLYRLIQERTGELQPDCGNCGQCCDFEAYGHRLYVTTLELLFFLRHLPEGLEAAPADAGPGRCPHSTPQGCRSHAARPSGCRIFYCQSIPTEYQQELTEQSLRALKQLHLALEAPYLYADWMAWLEGIRALRTGNA